MAAQLKEVTMDPKKRTLLLAEFAEQIERRHGGDYHATAEELTAIDEADRSGVASAEEVEEAFLSFRQA
jgi:hypothetical protein